MNLMGLAIEKTDKGEWVRAILIARGAKGREYAEKPEGGGHSRYKPMISGDRGEAGTIYV